MTTINSTAFLLARLLGIGGFAVNIVMQISIILDTPHTEPVYGPNSPLFALLLLGQGILQVLCLTRLSSPGAQESAATIAFLSEGEEGSDEQEADGARPGSYAVQLAYIPIFVIENICLSAWSHYWMEEKYLKCQIITMFNTALHLYAVFSLFPSVSSFQEVIKTPHTYLLSRTGAGIAIVYMWKTWGVIDKATAPSTSEQLQTGAFFLLLTVASGPDPTLCLCLVCSLMAMILGSHRILEWRTAFIYVLAAIAIVAALDYFLDKRASSNIESSTDHDQAEQCSMIMLNQKSSGVE